MANSYTNILFFDAKAVTLVVQEGEGAVFFDRYTYSGFNNGDFLADDFGTAVKSAFDAAKAKGFVFDSIYMNLPVEFSAVALRYITREFAHPRTINPADIDNITSVDEFRSDAKYESVTASPTAFYTDTAEGLISPIGMTSQSITAKMTYMLADRQLLAHLRKLVADCCGARVTFVSSAFAEALMLVEHEQRDAGAILLDFGYMATSVLYTQGDGLPSAASIPLGTAHIAADIAERLEVDFADAYGILRQISLSIMNNSEGVYHLSCQNQVKIVATSDINTQVRAAIKELSGYLIGAIKSTGASKNTRIFATGDGDEIRGFVKEISDCIGREIYPVTAASEIFGDPSQAELYAVVEFVKSIKNYTSKRTFLSKITSKIFGGK